MCLMLYLGTTGNLLTPKGTLLGPFVSTLVKTVKMNHQVVRFPE
jgi:hypothetical protein